MRRLWLVGLLCLMFAGCALFTPNPENPGGASDAETFIAKAVPYLPPNIAGPIGVLLGLLGLGRAYKQGKLTKALVEGGEKFKEEKLDPAERKEFDRIYGGVATAYNVYRDVRKIVRKSRKK